MKIIFNIFSSEQLGLDKWTICDTAMSIVDVACYSILKTITVENILDISEKQYFDWVSLIIVIATWFRLGAYLLVIHRFSVVLNTLFKMIVSASNFMLIVV